MPHHEGNHVVVIIGHGMNCSADHGIAATRNLNLCSIITGCITPADKGILLSRLEIPRGGRVGNELAVLHFAFQTVVALPIFGFDGVNHVVTIADGCIAGTCVAHATAVGLKSHLGLHAVTQVNHLRLHCRTRCTTECSRQEAFLAELEGDAFRHIHLLTLTHHVFAATSGQQHCHRQAS